MKLVSALVWLSYFSFIEALTPWENAKAREALMGKGNDVLIQKGVSPNAKFARMESGKKLWLGYPGIGVVPYVLSPALEDRKELIQKAMNEFSKHTCIRFIRKPWWTNDYIKLVKTDGCASYVGRIGGEQEVDLAEGCLIFGTILHELGHAIGMIHEQQRYDRDNYINVYWENIKQDGYGSFKKEKPDTFKYPYKIRSVMHYDNYAFSKNGRMTLWAKNGQTLTPPHLQPGLSIGDINHINKLYKCRK